MQVFFILGGGITQRKNEMKVKNIVTNCAQEDLIIIRDHGTELKATNIAPYKKAFAPYWERNVKDYWRDGSAVIVVLF